LALGCASDSSDPEATQTSGASASSSASEGSSGEPTTGGSSAGSTSSTEDLPQPDDAAAMAFLARIPGLWVGPVDSNTSVGDFPTMNMDMRAADGHVLFSRIDLDPDNSLRFAFTFEEHSGQRHLVFRNGGEFLGLLRDTRTVLTSADPDAGQWTFCALDGGCSYVEATFSFQAEDELVLDVAVMGMMHFTWPTTRREIRSVPDPFPADDASGSTEDPFPPMPTLRTTLRWTDPLAQETSAWLIVGTQPCVSDPANCVPSRFMRATAPAGATEVEVVLEQIHPGSYVTNAILDRNGNLGGATLLPDTGDLLAIPDQEVIVSPSGETTTTIMLSVEL
jgi:hypothetical protein